MGQADFDFNAIFDTGAIHGGNDGTARLHASLTASPLTGEDGIYCREFTNTTTGDIAMSATIKSTVNDGQFFEIGSGRVVSVRAWIRGTATNSGNYAMGIGAKIRAGAPPTDISGPEGYILMIGDVAQTITSPAFGLKFYADAGSTVFADNIVAATANTWHKVRLDIFPTSATQDDVFIYTGAGKTGSEVWTQVASYTVLSTDAHFIPWAESGSGKVGFFTTFTADAHKFLIDRFQVFLIEKHRWVETI